MHCACSDRILCEVQTSLQRESDALRTLNSLAAKVDLALATVETNGTKSLLQQPINDFVTTDKSLAGLSYLMCLLSCLKGVGAVRIGGQIYMLEPCCRVRGACGWICPGSDVYVLEVAAINAYFRADDLTQNSTSGATQLLDGLITITDPQLFSDGSAKIRNTAVGAAITATGLNYAPCMVVSAPAGIWLGAC